MSTLARLIGAAYGQAEVLPPPAISRRRARLWDIPSARHCALIGTCLPVAEMRKFATRCGFDAASMSDYALHSMVVGHCSSRCSLAESIQRFFDKRYVATVNRFASARDAAAVTDLWQAALTHGDDIAGALWAAWTHGATDEATGTRIFGDIHMVSHQVGAAARADLRQMEQAKAELARLRNENAALRRGMTQLQHAHDKAFNQQRKELAVAEQRAAHLQRRELELAAIAQQHHQFATLQQRAAALADRSETLEERNADNARRAARLELELLESRAELAAAEEALASALGVCEGVSGSAGCGKTCPAEQALAGRCVLCVGGRTGLVDGYRKLVEVRGGQFLHHDGGQEESLHRIDAAVAAADAVVCQSGCVSHAAYWRMKEVCKKLNKPCVFVQSPGIGSFARSLTALTATTPGTQVIRLHG